MGWAEVAQVGAEILDKGVDQYNANRAFSKNKWMAREQMRFQERMASTQYQRAAKDLEAAGLNRVLALGSPAAAPAGSTATYQAAKTPKVDLMAIASAKEAIEGQRQQNRILRAKADKEEATKMPYEFLNMFLQENKGSIENFLRNFLSSSKDADSMFDFDIKKYLEDSLSAAGSSAKDVYDDTIKRVKKFVSPNTPAQQRNLRMNRSANKLQKKELSNDSKERSVKRSRARTERNRNRRRQNAY